MNHLVVMYHYVRPDGNPIPAGIRPLWVSEFQQQLDWLSNRYDIVGADDFLDRVKESKGNRKPVCLLTFDDGTKDHAKVVTPILTKRGLSGVFFVLSWPGELGKMPLTHAVHWLLGEDEQNVWDRFRKLGDDKLLGSEEEARRIYRYESPLRARIKYAANMALPESAVETIVQQALDERGETLAELASQWFVSNDEIVEMHRAGMAIGSHGCSHRGLKSLGVAGIESEIKHCQDYLKSLIGKKPTWYACPFGGSGARLEEVVALQAKLPKLGIKAAVSTEKKFINEECDLLSLPRFDAIDLPPRAKWD